MKSNSFNLCVEELKKIECEQANYKFKEIITRMKSKSIKPKVINVGLLKAGKSSLFNALAGKNLFNSDVVRSTVKNQSIELDKYILVDTPGLDANEEDSKTAFEAYVDADVMIFVHNVQDGELNKMEIEALKEISTLFQCEKSVLPFSILVLSHTDQVEESNSQSISIKIEKQCKKIFDEEFSSVILVNSTGYMKGISESKNLLVEKSNINKLKEVIDSINISGSKNTLSYKYISKLMGEFSLQLDKELTDTMSLKREISSVDYEEKVLEAINESSKSITAAKKKLADNSHIPYSSTKAPYFSCKTRCNSYKKYTSEYQAKSDAREACSKAIRSAASETRKRAFEIISEYESYILPDGKIQNLKNELFNIYNDMKSVYYDIAKDSKTLPEFKVTIIKDSKVDSLQRRVEGMYTSAKYIAVETFRSSDYYTTRYSSNLDIDYDYYTEYVRGLFGEKEKEVAYYRWDIDGAIDDIKTDCEDILEERTEEARDICNELYRYYIDSLEKQFNELVRLYKNEISKELAKAKKLTNEKNTKLLKLDKKISAINNLKCFISDSL